MATYFPMSIGETIQSICECADMQRRPYLKQISYIDYWARPSYEFKDGVLTKIRDGLDKHDRRIREQLVAAVQRITEDEYRATRKLKEQLIAMRHEIRQLERRRIDPDSTVL